MNRFGIRFRTVVHPLFIIYTKYYIIKNMYYKYIRYRMYILLFHDLFVYRMRDLYHKQKIQRRRTLQYTAERTVINSINTDKLLSFMRRTRKKINNN